jgi:hypothetical protein
MELFMFVLSLVLSVPLVHAAPQGMGGIYNVTITRGTSTWNGTRSIYGPATPDTTTAPRGGLEGICLVGGDFPYKPATGDATKWTVTQSGDVTYPAETAAACGTSQPPPQLFSVLPCDISGQAGCPQQAPGISAHPYPTMLSAGLYTVASHAKNGANDVNGNAVLIVRPVDEVLGQVVETWCTDNNFVFAKSGSQNTPGGTAVTLADNVIEMSNRAVGCSDGSGGLTACSGGQAAVDCAANGAPNGTYPNRFRFHVVRTNAR